ncbi:MAG: type II secretion system F family protein [Candidatus Omnitrophica bacterium]|nr:type II secretion system F family protein [Candidatus Omnitrophota bacterium]
MIKYLFIFSAVVLLVIFISEVVIPYFLARYNKLQDKRATEISVTLEDSFIFWEKKKMLLFYLFPFIFSVIGLILFRHIIGIFIGFIFGFIIPKVIISMAKQQRLKKFRSQLVDALMIISSSLKAGLSFPQSIEVLCEEMPAPISQEFNLILSQNKLGVSMELALKNLRARIPTEEVNLVVTSILIARESGGNLPLVLSRLTGTIRDNLKLKEKIGTLTLQGRLQGIIMVLLPIGFAYFVYKQNPGHFDVMMQTDLGRKLLGLAVGLEIVGVIMIKKISTMKF